MSDRTCSIDGCDKREFARRWCRMHWNRWRRNDDPLAVKRIVGDDRRRILAKVDRSSADDCWGWTGKRNYNGYGRVTVGGKDVYAHRAVYELLAGPVPDGMDLDHECHNRDVSCPGGWGCPHRACVNPAHLVPKTPALNRGQANQRRAHP